MRVLAIVHEADAGPGVFGEAMQKAGAVLERWLIAEEPAPPAELSSYDAVITLGGAMHPDQAEQHPWMGEEQRFLAELIERRVPLLGVCLGAELVAGAAGATVGR